MTIKAEYLRDTCQLLVIELTRLQQLNRKLTIADFFHLSENGKFVSTVINRYGEYMRSTKHLADEESSYGKEMLSYLEDAFARHANVVTEGTYGVVDDAFLLAINVTVAIMREADQMD
ncbi:hypothetical protein ACJ5W8_002522 [Klebsiella pneumoniae]|uniref:hypothetical protein n=1 Tax=Klebsiella pneumoniae complex TaxID=3390273 RepID=UPI0013607B64|nr:hypothetical protein [Klebsiella pneumoniae]HDN2704419.1 hypothetical protein [Klebsiella aerogenes]MXR92030.1 hypothetical protein [Klebsiella pneumoniae]MXS55134.1 hypothetical protein [Klebsiella pneumoniae]HBQ2247224.1 hypothetical protein [Klebsiella pneumoniae]HBS6294069.1 hypothetical protein [Klebsiella pneumoniae]